MSSTHRPTPLTSRLAPGAASLSRRRCPRSTATSANPNNRSGAVAMAGFARYGVKEDNPDGTFMETYGLNLGGGNIGRESIVFGADATLLAFEVERPMGIVFEDVNGECVAVEIIEGSNAFAAGVMVGDVLRMTSAVAVGKSTVEVGKLQVEPSLGMKKKGANRRALFVADRRPFDAVMDAVVSNAEDVDGTVSPTVALLLERRS
mmetsp:Transcript_2792/g.10355  ORF Transcript_2792/g.10355 Transcript_2792/m.10355 type:complete len:205 (-) Transcript_2792:433-1047(-)